MIDNKQEAVNENVIAAITFYTNEILAEHCLLYGVKRYVFTQYNYNEPYHLYPLNIILFWQSRSGPHLLHSDVKDSMWRMSTRVDLLQAVKALGQTSVAARWVRGNLKVSATEPRATWRWMKLWKVSMWLCIRRRAKSLALILYGTRPAGSCNVFSSLWPHWLKHIKLLQTRHPTALLSAQASIYSELLLIHNYI